MNSSGTLVSVITITFNCEISVEKTIRSVLNQDYSNIQFIIIDGESKDGTLDIIKKYEKDISIIVSEKDRGISDAFNKGIRLAQGELVFFLNAGDVFARSDCIRNVISEWNKNREDIIFYRVAVGVNSYIPAKRYNDNAERIWNDCEVPHQGAFISRNLFKQLGEFNIFLKTRMDFEWFARCKTVGASYKYVPETIVYYELGGESMKSENARIFYSEGIGIKLIYGMPLRVSDFLYFFMPMGVRKIAKKILHR